MTMWANAPAKFYVIVSASDRILEKRGFGHQLSALQYAQHDARAVRTEAEQILLTTREGAWVLAWGCDPGWPWVQLPQTATRVTFAKRSEQQEGGD